MRTLIKSIASPDDFAGVSEVIRRRKEGSRTPRLRLVRMISQSWNGTRNFPNTESAISFEPKHLGLKVYGNAVESRDAPEGERENCRL